MRGLVVNYSLVQIDSNAELCFQMHWGGGSREETMRKGVETARAAAAAAAKAERQKGSGSMNFKC